MRMIDGHSSALHCQADLRVPQSLIVRSRHRPRTTSIARLGNYSRFQLTLDPLSRLDTFVYLSPPPVIDSNVGSNTSARPAQTFHP